jgi:hypothetical protein
MTYGVFQEFYTAHWTLEGSVSATGVIGTTQNGVMYLVGSCLELQRWSLACQLMG